ncbi:carbohydrate kinase family protein [Pseudonocardia broussonetiae]|uniref:Carbohydrate kinase family protein n=1 Tax=Pseudonocardia broussonetiae TaxID=2736640 RepID=A0A6M6JWB4_9PSEU|nr:carbohydrate kinase family protein [Pseudonocardia broussonetiae]QJY50802.1 carbohydrate kinase family protein [Pseudonocardia broussonetiae]
MHFPGRFAEHVVAEHLDRLSLSFLVDDLEVRRGGVAANIAYGLGLLGAAPVLVAAVGHDFGEYRAWLEAHGVDCGGVRVSPTAHTARFTCTTDDDQCQLASFYPGAMSEAREIRLAPLLERHGARLVLVGADDPEAMLAHTAEARALGVPFAADPSQQLPRLDGEQCRALVDGARYLFTNAYEWELLGRRTGWAADAVAHRTGTRVTTLGGDGVLVVEGGVERHVKAVPADEVVDPTGGGDGFRAGFLAAVGHGLGAERAAQLGALVATSVLESAGAQEWSLDPERDLARLTDAYGPAAAADLQPLLRAAPARVAR